MFEEDRERFVDYNLTDARLVMDILGKLEAHDAIPYNAAVMAAKGVNVSLNSDSNELARRLYWEAAKVVR